MKELTIEQKAKAYDKALEKARLVLQEKGNEPDGASILSELFPELIESEDEKIRKELVSIVDGYFSDKTSQQRKAYIAWLERQGEHVAFRKGIQVGDKVTRNEDGILVNLSQLKRIAKPNEMKLGKKPVDKVKPKFKVGDWIMLDRPVLITKVEDMPYNTHQYWTSDGTWFGDATKAKLWTIQDAKDGDVLAVEPIEGYSSSFVAIYKKQNEEDFDSYCFVGFDGKFYDGENGHSAENIHPATKEQRDTLMEAMTDAGYTFNFEKKELKKIEQKPVECKEKKYSKCSVYNLSHSEELCKDCEFNPNKQKPVEWSEEDINMIDWLIRCCEKEHEELCNDRYGHQDIVSDLKRNCRKKWYWLESLKEKVAPQKQWKPSEEQIEALRVAKAYPSSERREILETLYEDLEQLKAL